ncbi:hypothetical protein [Nostoc sp. UHCC 0870]|uniref:hypothetical protein n=1 Tax=Nostoc sp. UHCC 0870 TaxID=2914041 RepID=UPI001EE0AF6D|nr:hypothetical protein [Nostoc sp. UHCC 0870]UKP01480.1 hypothetical protein L6494_30255 [Nostoc sp. UHCC 0870]
MQLKIGFIFKPLLLGLLLTGCGSMSPQDLAKNHLELIKGSKSSEAIQQYCSSKDSLRLHSLKSFEILASQPKKEGELLYTEITAKIDTDQTVLKKHEVEGIPISKPQKIEQITLEVWKSDDFFSKAVSSAAKLNDSGEKVAALTGSPAIKVPTPVRSDFNKSTSCVFLPFKQFDNE